MFGFVNLDFTRMDSLVQTKASTTNVSFQMKFLTTYCIKNIKVAQEMQNFKIDTFIPTRQKQNFQI